MHIARLRDKIESDPGTPRVILTVRGKGYMLADDDADRELIDEVLGTTVGVGRYVDLPRRLTEEEWNQLVVDLRMTFDEPQSLVRSHQQPLAAADY